MRADVIEEAGGPEQLVLRDMPTPEPKEGAVTTRASE